MDTILSHGLFKMLSKELNLISWMSPFAFAVLSGLYLNLSPKSDINHPSVPNTPDQNDTAGFALSDEKKNNN